MCARKRGCPAGRKFGMPASFGAPFPLTFLEDAPASQTTGTMMLGCLKPESDCERMKPTQTPPSSPGESAKRDFALKTRRSRLGTDFA
jgi:hypothetical protein